MISACRIAEAGAGSAGFETAVVSAAGAEKRVSPPNSKLSCVDSEYDDTRCSSSCRPIPSLVRLSCAAKAGRGNRA